MSGDVLAAVARKRIEIEMPDGSVWQVPLDAVARHRAAHYVAQGEFPDLETSLREDTAPLFLDEAFEAIDWAANNMDWADVAGVAVQVKAPPPADFQEGWLNGDKRVVDAGEGR